MSAQWKCGDGYVIRGLAELPGRKSIVVLSDGFGLRDGDKRYGHVLAAVRGVVDAANRAGVVIHGMHAPGLTAGGYDASEPHGKYTGSRGTSRAAQDGLSVLAGDTGGLFIRDTNDLSLGLERILNDSQHYYLLGYVPDRATFSSAKPLFHTLTVRVKRPALHVRSRRGFLGQLEGADAPAADRMMTAVTSPFAGGDIRLRLSSFSASGSNAKGVRISQLTHPHICTLYDVGEHERTAFLVMEHLDGERLHLAGDAYPVAEDVGIFGGNSAAGFSVSSNGVLVYRPGLAAGGNRSLRWFDRQGSSPRRSKQPASM